MKENLLREKSFTPVSLCGYYNNSLATNETVCVVFGVVAKGCSVNTC